MGTDDRPSIAALLKAHAHYTDRRDMQAAANLIDAAPLLLVIAAAALAEAAAECDRQQSHWDYVEGGDEDVSCFKDIHCKVCPVSVAREKFKAALVKVRE